MLRIFAWLVMALNVILIGLYFMYMEPHQFVPINPERTVVLYTLWLIMSTVVHIALFSKADMVGEGVCSILNFSLFGTIALSVVVCFSEFTTPLRLNEIFALFYYAILGINTLGLLLINAFCFEQLAKQ